MLGSSQSIASPNVVLNTIMAQELEEFADILEQSNDFRADLQNLLHDTFKAHQRIIFDGNGYGGDWVREAQRRGLSNLRDTVDCMPAYIDPKNIRLFSSHNILSRDGDAGPVRDSPGELLQGHVHRGGYPAGYGYAGHSARR